MIDERLKALKKWARKQSKKGLGEFRVLHEQASFRRYFRAGGGIWVDAPVQQENLEQFVRVGRCLAVIGVRVPEIYAFDLEQGFLWQEDLGKNTLHSVLTPDNADLWYERAIKILPDIVRLRIFPPDYDQTMVDSENQLFVTWFLQTHLGLSLSQGEQVMLDAVFQLLSENHFEQPQGCVHRDYHSLNLMAMKDELGVIDFQDLVYGPVTYDVISLLEDCYVAWPDEQVKAWLTKSYRYFKEQELIADLTAEDFITYATLCGLQRHLKALGIFARLHHRDGKSQYLDAMPTTLAYTLRACTNHPELAYFGKWLSSHTQPIVNKISCEL